MLLRLGATWLVAGVAAAGVLVAEAQREDFPCEHHEWVQESWRPGTPADCTSCYVCSTGQECRRRGGCFNCTEREVDRDSDPLTPCTECPEGKHAELGQTRCTDPSLLEELSDKLKKVIVGAVGSALSIILVYCGCKSEAESEYTHVHITVDAMDRRTAPGEKQLAENSSTMAQKDPEDASLLLDKRSVSHDVQMCCFSRCWRSSCCCRRCCRRCIADVDYQELDPDNELPEPGQEQSADIRTTARVAHPESGLQPDDTHPFKSCLDRLYVQKELRWARQYNKKIIVVCEKDDRRQGFFDHGIAMDKYAGTEWEYILNIDAIAYQRDEDYADKMIEKILKKAAGAVGVVEPPSVNEPGYWDFFLSHAQATGGDQTQNIAFRLKDRRKAVWYDNAMNDRSTQAMEEGVKCSGCVVLFLSGDTTVGVIAPAPEPKTLPELEHEPQPLSNTLQALDREPDFVDRAVLRKELLDWAKDNKAHQGCVVVGGPGTGKTSLLKELLGDTGNDFHEMVRFCAPIDLGVLVIVGRFDTL